MEKLRELLKKNKLIFNIWNIFYQRKLKKIEDNKLKSKYTFIDRSKKEKDMCIILAGYKEFLWNDVFERIKKFIPKNIDVCIVSPGMYNEKLVKLCEENNWSYLSVEQNKVTLAQNIAINLYPNAEYIYKLDEDMFITENFFYDLKETYKKVIEDKCYKPGIIVPLINVNGYSYKRVLDKLNLTEKFEGKFGTAYMDASHGEPIIENADIAQFLWGKDNEELKNIDKVSKEFSKNKKEYTICPIRFSIGAMLLPRKIWEQMEKFDVVRGPNLGLDEVKLCQYCTISSRPIIVSENCLVGHFSYGPQTKEMKKYYEANRDIFSLKSNNGRNI